MRNGNQDITIDHIKRSEIPFNMPAKHYHEQFEIYYLLSGERFYFIENRTYHVKKGDIVLIDKNLLHKTNATNIHSHERILIQIDSNLLSSFNENPDDIDLYYCFQTKQNVYSLDPEEQLWVENHLFNTLKENKVKNDGYLTYTKILILELLIFLNRIAKSKKNFKNAYPDQTHKKMSEIAAYINSHYSSDLTLNKVAEYFNYSPTYLSKSFKDVTGFNFVEYKNNIRIKEAGKLLQQSNLNVTEIAGRVGYNNLTHFGRTFKKITGYSPLKYKRINKNKVLPSALVQQVKKPK